MARRCICRWRRCSWRRPRGFILPLGTQIVMMLTLMLTSKGVAGVPRASLVILAGTAASFVADRRRGADPGRRHADGYGAHVGELAGQLPGDRGGGALGRCGSVRRSREAWSRVKSALGGGASTANTTSRFSPQLRTECITPEGAKAPPPAETNCVSSPTWISASPSSTT